jgi:hypothetical protein
MRAPTLNMLGASAAARPSFGDRQGTSVALHSLESVSISVDQLGEIVGSGFRCARTSVRYPTDACATGR